jgi:hypothetical protein
MEYTGIVASNPVDIDSLIPAHRLISPLCVCRLKIPLVVKLLTPASMAISKSFSKAL